MGERDAVSIHEPAYRVVLDDPRHTEVFVKRRTGEIASWRNDAWRRFDALLVAPRVRLHRSRQLRRTGSCASPRALAVLTASLSGAGLLGVLLARRRRPGGEP